MHTIVRNIAVRTGSQTVALEAGRAVRVVRARSDRGDDCVEIELDGTAVVVMGDGVGKHTEISGTGLVSVDAVTVLP